MTKTECLQAMCHPGANRGPNSTIQICITNRCDMGDCSNCTQMIAYQKTRQDMSLENAKKAIDSLAGYPGIVGIFGGNPCLHPQFKEISLYLKESRPNGRRGIWTNNILDYGRLIDHCYNFFNFNVHGNAEWGRNIKAQMPREMVYGMPTGNYDGLSRHGAVMVSMEDVVPKRADRYDLIAKCDINQHWSAALVELDGKLCAFFCEVAASFARLNGDDSRMGVPVKPGWWTEPMDTWARQVGRYCHKCGVPLKLEGSMDRACEDTVSPCYVKMAEDAGRKVVMASEQHQVDELTDYLKLREGE